MAAVPLPASPAPRRAAPWIAPRSTRRPHLRVVGPPRHVGRFVALMLLAAAAGVFGTVSLNALAAEQAFAARGLEAEVQELSLRYEELTVEVATLAAPERVREVAVTELGMTEAQRPGFLVASRRVPGDAESGRSEGIVRSPLAGGEVADPVKSVLGAGR